jgi:hypothetical protein
MGTLTHKTHHGPDSGEATTFPHIVFSATLRDNPEVEKEKDNPGELKES